MFHEIDAENLGEVFQFCDYTRDEKLYNLSVLSKVFLFVVIMNEREKSQCNTVTVQEFMWAADIVLNCLLFANYNF